MTPGGKTRVRRITRRDISLKTHPEYDSSRQQKRNKDKMSKYDAITRTLYTMMWHYFCVVNNDPAQMWYKKKTMTIKQM